MFIFAISILNGSVKFDISLECPYKPNMWGLALAFIALVIVAIRWRFVDDLLVCLFSWGCFLFVLYLSIEADKEPLYHYRVE
jgi:hypothetical protein